MESSDKTPAHDPNDPRGGGGPGGGFGPEAQDQWKRQEQAKKDRAAGGEGEPDEFRPDDPEGPFEGDIRS